MKNLTKPISSPGRTEKFPPPLMRFLRSNVGSKSSRRRSRASPMFIKKKNTVIETTQEPSSPKVTCMGQVRVRRSNKNKRTTTTTSLRRRHHHRNRLCRCLGKLKPTSCLNLLSKWVSFFRCGCCKETTDSYDSPAIESFPTRNDVAGKNGEEHEKEENVNVIIEADNINQGLISKSPPRNALLLTRCRSAPYRSTSLASKLWESTTEKTGDEEEVAEKIKKLKIKKENGVNEKGTCNESCGVRELKAIKGAPLILSRCKSEPARTWDQLLV